MREDARVSPAELRTPRPAATVILMRSGSLPAERALEVLMVRRSAGSGFMPSVWVFPGGAVHDEDGPADDDEAAHMACAVRELREEAGIALPEDTELLAWSRWITPELPGPRFDARFYVAASPSHMPPEVDGFEVTHAAWIAPAEALSRAEAGLMEIVFPTLKHLESLVPYRTPDEVLAAAREITVEPILPKWVGGDDDGHAILPGEPGYE